MIIVQPYPGAPIMDQPFEIVERKGKGHPDSLCDSMMDAVSVALSKAYLDEFGAILHHNIDKGLLAAGAVNKRFGGGEMVLPMELTIGDRATAEARGKRIPVADIAVEAARSWLAKNMRYVDPDKHMNYRVLLAQGSEELTGIFARPGIKAANDTSATVGYYPLSPTEQIVLALERYLNSPAFRERHEDTGEDVKVMALRQQQDLELTVAMPLLCRQIRSERDYFDRKEAILGEMQAFVREFPGFQSKRIHYNTLDERGKGLDGVYLSLTGTSAEDADSGQVGRGNRVNGVISLNRPMGTEAAAGKNPVSHVGKIYNILSHRMARRVFEGVEGIREVYVYLVSRIGSPVNEPWMTAVQIVPGIETDIEAVTTKTEEIVGRELSDIEAFCADLSEGKYPL